MRKPKLPQGKQTQGTLILGARPPSGVVIGALADDNVASWNFYVSNVVGAMPTTALAGERDPHPRDSSNSDCKKVMPFELNSSKITVATARHFVTFHSPRRGYSAFWPCNRTGGKRP
jgi:hypothetical protein